MLHVFSRTENEIGKDHYGVTCAMIEGVEVI